MTLSGMGTDTPLERTLHVPERLDAVRATGLLDSPSELFFDRLIRLAAEIVRAPAAFLSLVDEERDFYKSSFGFDEEFSKKREVRGETFCHHTLLSGGRLVVDDTRQDPRFRHIPTIKSLGVESYVGIVLSVNEHPVGAFCVIDHRPRRWLPKEVESIAVLARAANGEIAARARARTPPTARADSPNPCGELSPREVEVLSLLLEGRPAKEIAFELGVSEKTVATLRSRILKKLQLGSHHELIVYAVRNGLVRW